MPQDLSGHAFAFLFNIPKDPSYDEYSMGVFFFAKQIPLSGAISSQRLHKDCVKYIHINYS